MIFGANADVGRGALIVPLEPEGDRAWILLLLSNCLLRGVMLTIMLFRFEFGTITFGRWGIGGGVSPLIFAAACTLEAEPLAWYVEGGVVLPRAELRVEEDFAVATVPVDSVDESEVRKLAFDRLRNSLKKGIADTQLRG